MLGTPLTCKGMAKAIWDGDNRKTEGAYQTGCRSTETHPARTTTGATKTPRKTPTTHPNLMFHYQCFWPPNRSWGNLSRFTLSKNVEDCRTHHELSKYVEIRRN